MRYNTWRRKALALASVPALAVPSAIGVERYLAPESGAVAAWSAAVGFEVLYVGVNILILRSPELRRYARNVSLAAVATAVLLNSLAHYRTNVPAAYSGAPFSVLAFALALVASLPLAGLAYAVSVLLHRLSEDEAAATEILSEALAAPPAPAVSVSAPERPAIEAPAMPALTDTAARWACPRCGIALASGGAFGAAKTNGGCKACRKAVNHE